MDKSSSTRKKMSRKQREDWSSSSSKKSSTTMSMKPSDWIASVRGESKDTKVATANAVPEVVELLNMKEHTSRVKSTVSIDEPLFQPSPCEIHFRKYEPFKVYRKKLFLSNNDSVSRRIKIVPPDSAHFSVTRTNPGKNSTSKVASGMRVSYTVTFKPHEVKDYACDLVCITEREKFVVPVRAAGRRPCLDLPDSCDFGICAVRHLKENVLLARNIGDVDAKFSVEASGPFSAQVETSVVKVGGVTQITLGFNPKTCGQHEGELIVTYAKTGQRICVQLTGIARDVDVSLESDSVNMESQFISLQNHRKFRIHNRSSVAVAFAWKLYSDEQTELDVQGDRLATIGMSERDRKDELSATFRINDDTVRSIDNAEECAATKRQIDVSEESLEFRERMAVLDTKYRTLRFDAARDAKHFSDEAFTLDVLEGKISPNSSVEIAITFSPREESEYRSTAYLEIQGREKRLPLRLEGEGVGPKATFSGKLIDMGDIFINSEWNHTVKMDNRAIIPCAYSLVPPTSRMGKKFKFLPESGVLEPGKSQKIEVSLCSDLIGKVDELFQFAMEGSKRTLEIHIKGHVVGPTFHFDVDGIDFGVVSLGFKHSEPLCLYNTSDIPMNFSLHVPRDAADEAEKEFKIVPAKGTVKSGDKIDIDVTLISRTLADYDYSLAIDVEGVGRSLLSIPVHAESRVPEIVLEVEKLNFGQCFLRHPYEQTLKLVNRSEDLRARYEILPQIQHTKVYGTVTPALSKGTIEPGCTATVDVNLVCEKLGHVKMPVYVRILGSDRPPLVPKISANCIGPIVKPDRQVVQWGRVACLRDHLRTLTLRNESPIPAKIQCAVEDHRSKFRVDVLEHVLDPHDEIDLGLTVHLDDIVTFRDNLTVEVCNGSTLDVPLIAKGDGTTMHCDNDLNIVDFGHRFTSNRCERKFLLENKGRRSQVLTWTNQTLRDRKALRRKRAQEQKRNPKPQTKKQKAKAAAEERANETDESVFFVTPKSVELKPRTACYFTFVALSKDAGAIEEVLVCESKMGKDQSTRKIFESTCKASFIDPLLEVSETKLDFLHMYTDDSPAQIQEKPITFKNISALPLHFSLRAATPFSTDADRFMLKPGERGSAQVSFDPGYKADNLSCCVEGKLRIAYDNHPQKDEIGLLGDINFPNLDFEFTEINFGVVLNDMTKSMSMTVTNDSKIACTYSWAFMEDEEEARALATAKRPFIPVNQVFDILPIRSHLKPGESEVVEFLMYGHANRQFRGTCICEVEGGPDYEVTLVGGASHVSYEIETDELDFGELVHDHVEEKEFFITNTSSVPLNFRVLDDKVTREGVISVYPKSGRIFGKERARIVVRFCPILPEHICEHLVVEVGHFEPVEVLVRGVGIYSSVTLLLPHDVTDAWDKLLDSARAHLAKKSKDAQHVRRIHSNATRPTTVASNVSSSAALQTTTRPETVRSTNLTVETMDEKSPFLALEVEAEAQRLSYMKYLQDLLRRAETASEADGASVSVASKRPETSRTLQSTARSTARHADSVHDLLAAGDFVVTNYFVDFGNVVAGQSRKRTINLTNTGFAPVSFTIQRSAMASNAAFDVEPEKVTRLPEGASTKIIARLNTSGIRTGAYHERITVHVRGGPNVTVDLRANVSVPELRVSSSAIDFGNVLVGRRKVVTVAFENPSSVPTRWTLRKKISGPLAKYADMFRIVPSSGTLRPNKTQHVQIMFAPGAEQRYRFEFQIRINSSRQKVTIAVKGRGRELRLAFDPPSLVMKPVLPNSGPTLATVTARNQSDCPIEFFALDFDDQFMSHEATLRDADARYEDPETGLLALPPHIPGEPLRLDIVEEIDYDENDGDPFDRSLKRNLLLYGHSRSKISATAKELGRAEEYDLAVVTLSDIIADERRRNTSRWSNLSHLLDEAEQEARKNATSRPSSSSSSRPTTSSSKKGGKSKKTKKTKKNNKETESNETKDAAKVEPDVSLPVRPNVGLDIVVQMLWSFLRSAQCKSRSGVIFNGLECAVEVLDNIGNAARDSPADSDSKDPDCAKNEDTTDPSNEWYLLRQSAHPKIQGSEGNLSHSLPLFDTLRVAEMLATQLGTASAGGMHAVNIVGDNSELKSSKENEDESDAATKVASKKKIEEDDVLTKAIESVFCKTDADAGEEFQDAQGRITVIRVGAASDDTASTIFEKIVASLSIPKAIDIVYPLPEPFEQWLVQRPPRRLTRPVVERFRFRKTCDALDTFFDDVAGHYVDENKSSWTIGKDGSATCPNGSKISLKRESLSTIVGRLDERTVALTVRWNIFHVHGLCDEKGTIFTATRLSDDGDTAVASESASKGSNSRWVLQPKEEVRFDVMFSSDRVGKEDVALTFEVAGSKQQQSSLLVRGVVAIPTINTDPRNVFMRRAKGGPVERMRKKYVQSRGRFEFGPLLVGKSISESEDDEESRAKLFSTNAEDFRISNDSSFDATVSFRIEEDEVDSAVATDDNTDKSIKKQKKASPKSKKMPSKGGKDTIADVPRPTFSVTPTKIRIPSGETKNVTVWALPQRDGDFVGNLVCCVENNPDPVSFRLHCLGSSPKLAIEGPWMQNSEATKSNDEEESEEAAVPRIDFERLLVGRTEHREFVVRNVCSIPVAWRAQFDTADADVAVSPTSGVLKPGEFSRVTVTFHATVAKVVDDFKIEIEYADTESDTTLEESKEGKPTSSLSVLVRAEGYQIESSVALQDLNGDEVTALSFGVARVGELVRRTVRLGNRGKYPIRFNSSVKRPHTANYFRVEPSSVDVEPGTTAEVSIIFETKSDDCEMVFQDNKDVYFEVIEIRSGEVHSDFEVPVNASSVFSKFLLKPSKGINFGPLKVGTERKRTFELRNDGAHPFQFKLLDLMSSVSGNLSDAIPRPNANFPNEQEAIDSTRTSRDKKSVEPDVNSTSNSVLVLDKHFHISPSEGTIVPNATQSIDVVFRPTYPKFSRTSMFVDVSSRSPHEAPESFAFDVSGESCTPQIMTSDYESIFEEQEVVKKLNMRAEPLRRAFVEASNAFTFGAIVPHAHPNGVKARFKISNATKIPCTVNFAIKSRAGANASVDDKDALGAFTVMPATENFPPHEHRYVTVWFKPAMIRKYAAIFEATVAEAKQGAEGSVLSFDLLGEGTMPCVTVVRPLARNDSGQLSLDFGRVQTKKSKTLSAVLRNDGILPATLRVTIIRGEDDDKASKHDGEGTRIIDPPHPPMDDPVFRLNGSGSAVKLSLAPKESRPIDVTFAPSETYIANASLRIDVLQNRFGSECVSLVGESYLEDIYFDGLPDDAENELRFESVYLSEQDVERNAAFSISNRTTRMYRFSFSSHDHLRFVPSEGHLGPRESCNMIASFLAKDSAVALRRERVPVTVVPIRLLDDEVDSRDRWNNSKMQRNFDDASSKTDQPEERVLSEPKHEVVEAGKELEFFVTAQAGNVTYDCNCPRTLSFRDTMMFQTRRHSFTLQNPSNADLRYDWTLFDNDTDVEDHNVSSPFVIEPSSGVIRPGESQSLEVRFAPTDAGVFRYTARCRIPHLPPNEQPLAIALMARARRPVCHFDVPHSDYLSRRTSDLPGTELLGASTQVIETTSLGTNVRNTKRFYVINPTNAAYEFLWEPMLAGNGSWRCASKRGLILPGKRFEMSFEYVPQAEGLHESFWKFSVPQRHISATFLLVGNVVEPRVHLDTAHVHFRQVLVGGRSTETIHVINEEHIPFAFSFDHSVASDAAGRERGDEARPKLVVSATPSRGVVPPNGKFPISLIFSPAAEKEYNVNLVCSVKNMSGKLGLNAKGEGYGVHERLHLEDARSGVPLTPSGENSVDFGTLTVNSKASKHVVLVNEGKFNFDFVWSRTRKYPSLTVIPSHGTVRPKQMLRCKIEFNPKSECALRRVPLICTIAGSRKYGLVVSAVGSKANIDFSFTQFDFGPCFVGSGGKTLSKTATLRVTNNEIDRDVTLDCLFERKSHLEVKSDPVVLAPNESVDVPFVFTPQRARMYSDVVVFEVNSLYVVKVFVKGEGTPLALELNDPAHRRVVFGAARVGDVVSRKVELVNRSQIPVSFRLTHDVSRFSEREVTVWPTNKHTLRSQERVGIELKFNPSKRIESFTETLRVLTEDGHERSLLDVSGACLDAEVSLDVTSLPFGVVTLGSSVKRRVRIQNTGDVAANFRWRKADFGPHFSISPMQGTVAPNTDIAFEVVFAPKSVAKHDIRCDTPQCYVEGADTLKLELTGSCIEQPPSKELRFDTRVRDSQTKTVKLSNPSADDWHVRSVFGDGAWSGAEFCHIPAGSTAEYEIVYRPLTMTTNSTIEHNTTASKTDDASQHSSHRGSLFFAMPSGKTESFALVGTATSPTAEQIPDGVALSVPCKRSLRVDLPVRNWLGTLQRFSVDIGVDTESRRPTTFVRGPSKIVVPDSSVRPYKMTFEAWTPGKTKVRVTFTNKSTGEYLFYDLVLEATEAGDGSSGRLHMVTNCRKVTSKRISLRHPIDPMPKLELPSKWWSCSESAVRVRKVEGSSQSLEFDVDYRPLLPTSGDHVVPLVLNLGDDLGLYKYELSLDAKPSTTATTLPFKTSLGSLQSRTFKFKSYAAGSTTYTCKVGRPDIFRVASQVTVPSSSDDDDWSGTDASVDVSFEPDAIATFTDVLTVVSSTGGKYRCVLRGECSPPLPQGPLKVLPDAPTTVSFKNVFNSATTFTCTLDNPLFTVTPSTKEVPAKSETKFVVSRSKDTSGRASSNGRLIISCPKAKEITPWIYYLSSSGEK